MQIDNNGSYNQQLTCALVITDKIPSRLIGFRLNDKDIGTSVARLSNKQRMGYNNHRNELEL